jgi:hypothetical protein
MYGNQTFGLANYLTNSSGEWIHFSTLLDGTDCNHIQPMLDQID